MMHASIGLRHTIKTTSPMSYSSQMNKLNSAENVSKHHSCLVFRQSGRVHPSAVAVVYVR